MLGVKTAQIALSFGADDIDGTVVHEKIYHDAGSKEPQELTVAELRRLIEEAAASLWNAILCIAKSSAKTVAGGLAAG
jgi:2-iminoacetate synthase ThiH